jgi:tRNA 2-thiouridine synthesizing protein B
MTLHMVNKDPLVSNALSDCLAVLAVTEEDAALLLIEDAVNLVLQGSEALQGLKHPCYVLQEDLQARGLLDRLGTGFILVDYGGFVRLSLDYAKVQSWG